MKRLFDFVIASIAFILISPILIFFTILIYHKLGSPVFFTQPRPGRNSKVFNMIKFRTMLNESDGNGNLLPDKDRITPLGKILRATSIDELPELLNVIKGDMSLVGPRPLLVEYLPLYSKKQTRRHDVRPGITGWAQVNGRNALSWEKKFELDVWYVENQSFWLDLKILLLTFRKVLKREGISEDGEVTMTPFKGNDV